MRKFQGLFSYFEIFLSNLTTCYFLCFRLTGSLFVDQMTSMGNGNHDDVENYYRLYPLFTAI